MNTVDTGDWPQFFSLARIPQSPSDQLLRTSGATARLKPEFSPLPGHRRKKIVTAKIAKIGASLVAQLVKNPPVMQETQVRFLDREDPLEEG